MTMKNREIIEDSGFFVPYLAISGIGTVLFFHD
jgi:hypothetical protein